MNVDQDNKETILVVDDTPMNLKILFEYLDRQGYKVLVAQSGENAIKQARDAHPDLILLDVMMPSMGGFEVCNALTSFEETKEIPIVFITALADAKNKLHGFEVGAVDYVPKPLQYTEVLAHIQTHLTMRRLQNDLRAQNLLLQQEIIQRKQAEEKLYQRTLDLQARNEELDAFARTVAHDIKSPLNTVIGYAELLQEETQLPSELDRFVQNIINSSYQISNITNGLLFLTRLRTTEPTLEPLDMTEIVLRSQSRLSHLLEKYQADIRMLDQWPISLGYDSWVEEVWRSYLSNAFKYGGRPPVIELGATPQPDGYIRFWVRDNGLGLPPNEQFNIFRDTGVLE